jgi:hypothetical protein
MEGTMKIRGCVELNPPGRSDVAEQAAKTTLFAAGDEADIRKNRHGRFFPIDS